MEKKTVNNLKEIHNIIGELYKDELDSHNIKKVKNNIDIMANNCYNIKKLSNKNIKYYKDYPFFRNTLVDKTKSNKDSINVKSFKPKESKRNLFIYSNDEESQKEEEEKINDLKVTKKNNFGLKVCKTFKNCGDNINKAKYLFLGKSNYKQSMKPIKHFNSKNCLTSNKRGSFFPTTKRHRKIKEKESSENNNIEIIKKKQPFHRSSNSNNKLLHISKNNIIQEFENSHKENNKENNKENDKDNNKDNNNKHYYKDNKDNKDNCVNIIKQFKRKRTKSNYYIKHYITSNSNRNPNKQGFTFSTKEKRENDKNKKKIIKKNSKNNQEIVYDTDNEVENKILSILDKSFKKRNSVINNKKKKHYCTQELANDNYFKNFHNSIAFRNNKTNNYDKISNFSNISIIKKTEFNNYDINNNDESEDIFQDYNKKKSSKFKGVSEQKVESFIFHDNDNDNEEKGKEDNINYNAKNKRKKKFIIYNNIDYYKNTQKEDNDDIIIKNEDVNNEEKNINNNKNSGSNNFTNHHCCYSFFNCCFLFD